MNYKDIARRYEQVARLESDELRRVSWNNKERAILRYQSIIKTALDLFNNSHNSVILYDIGCGLCSLYDQVDNVMRKNRNISIEYHGFDISKYLVEEAMSIRPNLNIRVHDFLNPKNLIETKCDLAVMNGLFTQKFSLSRQMMLDFIVKMIGAVIKNTSSVVVFNVMSDEVDYMLDDAFHMSRSEIEDLMAALKINHYSIDRVVPYEYYVRAYVQ